MGHTSIKLDYSVAGYLKFDSKQMVLTEQPTMQIRVIVHVHAEQLAYRTDLGLFSIYTVT